MLIKELRFMCPTFVHVLSFVASHTCAAKQPSTVDGRLSTDFQNVQVSDTTGDAMKHNCRLQKK